jgi:hypothetical protein
VKLTGFGRYKQKTRSMTASAQVLTAPMLRQALNRAPWQRTAWGFYETVGELHYAINYLAQAGSRARLYVGTPDPDGAADPTPTQDAQSEALLGELGDSEAGHAQLLSLMFIHLSVAGETFLIGYDDPATSERVWTAAANEALEEGGGKIRLRVGPAMYVPLPEDSTTIIRIHIQDARFPWMPDSNVRAVLTDLARLQALSSHILATCDSRLSGAGLLLIAESISTPPANPEDEENNADPVVDGLISAMSTALNDQGTAASVVPFTLRAPDEVVKDGIKHLTFSTPFDKEVPTLVDMTLRKIAIGLNMPAETLLGTPQNHWSAWQKSEEFVNLNVEPLLQIICQALTAKYMKPSAAVLSGSKSDTVIWYDTTELVARPNKGPESITLYGLGLVGAACTRRENGFSDDDAPTDEERLKTLLWELAHIPAAAAVVLPLLGMPGAEKIQVPVVAPPGASPTDPLGPAPVTPPPDAGPRALPARPSAPAGADTPGTAPVQHSAAAESALIAACEATVLRALEVAGKRIRTRASVFEGVEAWAIHTVAPQRRTGDVERVSAGAFALAHMVVPDVEARNACVRHTYALLSTGAAYERAHLVEELRLSGCL